jgi:hypothetical protein
LLDCINMTMTRRTLTRISNDIITLNIADPHAKGKNAVWKGTKKNSSLQDRGV